MTALELKRYNPSAWGWSMGEDLCGEYVRFADVEAYTQAAIAAAVMGAVKPLEWEEDVDYRGNRIWKAVSPITGEKYWSLDGAGYREYQDKEHAARILSALSIPTDATATLSQEGGE